MKRRFAPLALLFGMIAALMLGSTSMALAHGNPHSGFNCNNGLLNVNLVTCSTIIDNVPVVVNIFDNDTRVLTNNELATLENSLNNLSINVLNINTLNNVEAAVLNVYGSFNPTVVVSNVQLCIALACLS